MNDWKKDELHSRIQYRLLEDLSAAEKRYLQLVENLNDVFFKCNEHGNLIFLNPAWEENLGHSIKNSLGRHVLDFLLPLDREVGLSLITEQKNQMRKELRFCHQNGSVVWFELSLLKSETENLLGLLHNITKRKQAEEVLKKASQELEMRVEERTAELKVAHEQLLHAEKLNALGKLAASIAHEINNPIYGVIMVLEQLYQRPEFDENERESLSLAIKECARISNLIKNLRDFYHPSTGIATPRDIHQTINETLQVCQNKLKINQVRIIKDFADNIPHIKVIDDQIKQVFLNIITNAEEAMVSSGGCLTIQTRLMDNKIQILFKDNGRGIAEKNMTKIFEPFFSTKTAVSGTGLGLSVSYGIIQGHGGSISVESALNEGSTFTIELPIKRPKINCVKELL